MTTSPNEDTVGSLLFAYAQDRESALVALRGIVHADPPSTDLDQFLVDLLDVAGYLLFERMKAQDIPLERAVGDVRGYLDR